jgi:hypothetical protein
MAHPWLELDEEALMEKVRSVGLLTLMSELKDAIDKVDGRCQRLFAVRCAEAACGIAPVPYREKATERSPSGMLIETTETPADAAIQAGTWADLDAARRYASGGISHQDIADICRTAHVRAHEEFRSPLHHAYRAVAATLLPDPRVAAIQASYFARECARCVTLMVSQDRNGDKDEARVQFRILRDIWQGAKAEGMNP